MESTAVTGNGKRDILNTRIRLWQLQCLGCDKKILWPSVGLQSGPLGTCWSSLVDVGLVGIWRERSAKPIMMAGKLRAEVRNAQVLELFGEIRQQKKVAGLIFGD